MNAADGPSGKHVSPQAANGVAARDATDSVPEMNGPASKTSHDNVGQNRPTFWLGLAVGVAFTLLACELLALRFFKVDIQRVNCWLPEFLMETFPLGDDVNAFLSWWHKATNSFIYMQVAFVVASFFSIHFGAQLYLYIIFGHLIKNFSKSFIASPRGFWFCTSGHAVSCGGGTG